MDDGNGNGRDVVLIDCCRKVAGGILWLTQLPLLLLPSQVRLLRLLLLLPLLLLLLVVVLQLVLVLLLFLCTKCQDYSYFTRLCKPRMLSSGHLFAPNL